MIKQRTLKSTIRANGVGVHSGEKINMALHPAPINTGIIFRRVDLNPAIEIPARIAYSEASSFCTSLINHGERVATIEHLLSAFSGLGIDNCIIDISSPELPIMDGSASPFVFLIQSAGIAEQDAPKKFLRITKSIEVKDGDKFAKLTPFHGFQVAFEIAFDHPAVKKTRQSLTLDFSAAAYINAISRARTFGFLSDYDTMKKKNLAKGASLENTVVVDADKVMNEDGLRYPDEFIKHKILDVIGDLYLFGHNVIGAFTGYKSGHALNSQLMHAVLAQSDAWELITFDDEKNAPPCYHDPDSI